MTSRIPPEFQNRKGSKPYSAFRFIPAVFKKRPVHLTFFVTKKCNQKCFFCFYTGNSSIAEDTKPLTLKEIEAVSSSFGTLLWLALSGGEVFLRDDIDEICRIFYEKNKPSIILLPTNGMLPDLIREKTFKILKNCKKSVIVVKLSMDGIGDKHDSIRRAEGSFNKVLKTYDLLSPLLSEYPNFELGINTVFCSLNQDFMDEIIGFVRGLDRIKTHTISLVRGNPREDACKDIDINKYLKAIERLERDFRENQSPVYGFKGARLKAAQDILQRRLIYKTVTENRRQIPCYAGRLNLVITENGDVFPCEEFDKAMGNVRDWGFDIKRLMASKQAKAMLSEVKECFCTHECYMMTNILFNPTCYPSLFKVYL